jgi:Protein of unknown function (DUF3800)
MVDQSVSEPVKEWLSWAIGSGGAAERVQCWLALIFERHSSESFVSHGQMPTYIDESGDTGTKDGATPYFRLGAVIFESVAHAEQYTDCLSSLRESLRLPSSFEFRFASTGHPTRTKFFQAIAAMSFSFVVSSLQKSVLVPGDRNKQAVREKTIRGLIKHLETQYLLLEDRLGSLRGLKELVIVDQCDDPTFMRLLKDHFKPLTATRSCGRKLVRDIRSGKSHSEPCLQLVDMICGAIGKHLDGRSDYYDLLQCKNGVIEEVR